MEETKNTLKEVFDLLESVRIIENGLPGTANYQFGLYLVLKYILPRLQKTPLLRSKYSRTISAISEDLGIAQEKLGSGHTPDTTPETIGETSGEGEKSSTQESDS